MLGATTGWSRRPLVDSHLPADHDSLHSLEVDAWGHPKSLAVLAAPVERPQHPAGDRCTGGTYHPGCAGGMQIIAGRYDDEMTFRVAHAYELATEPLFAEGARPGYRAGSE